MRVTADPSVCIRRALSSDRDFVGRLAQAAFFDFDPKAGEHTLENVATRGAVTLIATRREDPLGFAVIDLGRGEAALQAIAVEVRERGRGVGRSLLDSAEILACRHGAGSLRLCTAQANVEALSLFLKHGFRIQRRMRKFYPSGQDACMLGKLVLVPRS